MMDAQDMMSNTVKLCIVTIFIVAATSLFSCGEDPPPASQAVKKKIAGQPTKSAAKPAAVEDQTQAAAPKSGDAKAVPPAGETADSTDLGAKLVEASKAFAGAYNPRGRFDPFEPLFRDKQEEQPDIKKNRKKRIPRTPLERVALSQLKLSAIMRTAKGNSAIVEDATGKGYVIRKGTYIGLNSGQVIEINKNRVMIEEESEDISGELRIHNTELKLQKPAGEL
jgi:type IV pilus assembly protein PilP